MTPNDPRQTFDPEKLMHMYELHEYTMKNRRANAFSLKIKISPL